MNASSPVHPFDISSAPASPGDDAMHRVLQVVGPGLGRMQESLAAIAQPRDPLLGPMLATILPGSGKRLRPALALLTGRLGEVDAEVLNHMALGVELLHTASLVHDDVVDSSDTRRGTATLFTRVGNALAVLVGDYLFSQAAQECVATGNLRVVRLFAETLGAMAQGQIDEANAHRASGAWRTTTRDTYYRTIWGKTAALFVLACEGTAVLAGFSEDRIQALRAYGDRLGLAFQVVDDILDFTSTEAVLGKPVGGDLRQGTITLPVILLREKSSALAEFNRVFEDKDVDGQIRLVLNSGAIEAAHAEAQRLISEAQQSLHVLPASGEKSLLLDLAAYVAERRL